MDNNVRYNSYIYFKPSEIAIADPMFSERIKVLERAIAVRFKMFSGGKLFKNQYMYHMNCTLESNSLTQLELCAQIANGQFHLVSTEICFMGINKHTDLRSDYETRHWFQGNGHEGQLVSEELNYWKDKPAIVKA